MMMLMIVGLLISLNTKASEWSPDRCYKKHFDDPGAVIIEDDPYGLSKSAPTGPSKNPLYLKDPHPLRKVKSDPQTNTTTLTSNFEWDGNVYGKSPAIVSEKKKKISLLTKIKRSFTSDLKLKEDPNAPRN